MTDKIVPLRLINNRFVDLVLNNLQKLEHIQERETRWICRNFIAEGEVTLLSADPGAGKTQLAVSLAAWLTRNGHNTLFWSPEVNFGRQVKAAFLAANGDQERLSLLNIRSDLGAIANNYHELLACTGAKVIILDTFMDFANGINTWVDHEVARVMLPLRHAVQNSDRSVFIVAHNRKDQSGQKQFRLSGSAQISGQAGQVLLMHKVEGSRQRRVEIAKSNIGVDDLELYCQLDPLPEDKDGVMMSWPTGSPEFWTEPYTPEDIPEPDPEPIRRGPKPDSKKNNTHSWR